MSVHDKTKVPPHRHFKDEIDEARMVRPDRPAYKGVHSSDVVIDSVLTLDQAGAEFLRHWEAEDAETKDAEWVEVSDASASKGKALKILSTDPNGKTIKFVTGDIGIGGQINFIVRAKVADNASSSNVFHFGIWDNDTSSWLVPARYVKANEFPSSNKYHHFTLKVEVPEDKNNLWVMFKFSGNGVTNVWCDFGGFVPANVPLDFADVDITDDDAIVTVGIISDDQNLTSIAPTTYTTVVLAGTWTDVTTINPSVDTELYLMFINARTNAAEPSNQVWHRLYDQTAGKYYPAGTGILGRASNALQAAYMLIAPANVNGHTLKLQVKCNVALTVYSDVTRWQHSQHVHDHEEYSPQHGQSGGSDLGHDH